MSRPTRPVHRTEGSFSRVYLMIGILMVVVLSLVGYSLYSGNKASQTYAPLVDAAMEIKLEATIGHLWFEEIISGDRHEDIEQVWQHLEQSVWYAQAMLKGGSNSEGTFIPLVDPELRRQIEEVANKLSQFRAVAEQRYAARERSAAGTDIDEQFDAVFRDFMLQADSVETELQKLMNSERIRFNSIQCVLTVLCLVIAALVVFVLRRERAHLLSVLQEAKKLNTDHLLALDKLRESEARYRRAQTISLVGSWEYDLQTTRFSTSDEGKRIYGFDLDDADFTPDEVEKCIPERERVHQALVDLVEKNEPYNLEFEIRPRNGAEPRIITSIAELKRDDHGAPLKIVGVIQDITERKQMEEALRESEARLRLIVNQSPLGICVNDLDGRYVSANPAYETLSGYTEQELLELTFFDLTHPDDRPENHRLFDGLTAEDSHNFTLEKRYIRKNGTEINVIVHGGAICDASGTPRFGLALVEDITERKQAETELRKSEATTRNKLKAIVEPDGDFGTLELSDIIDTELLQAMLEDFYRLTGMLGAVLDLSGNVLIAVGWQDICTKFHRCHPESCKNCIESDTILTAGVPEGTFKAYRCKNNMWDMVTPLIVGGRHVGNVFIGQFFYEDEVPDVELFRKQARLYGFDEREYLEALDRAPRFSRETAEAGIMFYTKLAQVVSTLSFNALKQSRMLVEQARVEDVLRESEARARLMADLVMNSNQPVGVGFLDGRLGRLNPAFCELTGYTEKELQAIDWSTELTPPEWLPAEREALAELERTDEPVRYEKEYIHKDGTRIPIELLVHLARDADGNPDYYYAFITDITQRKQEQAKLQLLSDALDDSLNAFDIVSGDGTFSYVNKSYVEMWGYENAEEIIGTSPIGHCLDPEQAGEIIQSLNSTGKYEGEFTAQRKDGSTFEILMAARLAHDAEGHVIYPTTSIDITERKRAEEELRQSESQLKASQETAHLGTWELDLSSSRITWTDEVYRIFGMKPGEAPLTYASVLERVHPEDRAYKDQVTEQIASEGSASFEYRVVRPNGDIRWISGRGESSLDETGHPVRILGIAQDITERKRIEQELKTSHDFLEQRVEERTFELKARKDEAETLNRAMINLLQDLKATNLGLETAKETLRTTNKELEAFSYSVSHDLRAPLRHIDGFVNLLLKREKEQLDATSARYLDTIAQSSGRMGRLIDDLLAFSRTGRAEMRWNSMDSNKVIREIVEEMAPITKDRHLIWEIDNLPVVEADGSLLRQVWQNLIGNAIKYTAPRAEARIEIGFMPESGEQGMDGPAFFIRDNGVGFDPQYSHKLFGVFQRLHRNDEFEGTGIGLATVRRIVHRHGGRVWAEGKVDHGATFYFTLSGSRGTNYEPARSASGPSAKMRSR